jgi:hypothetical protein
VVGSSESGSNSGHVEVADGSTTVPPRSEGNRARPRQQVRVWAIALAGGVVAGLVSWLAGESAYGAFRPKLFKVVIMQSTHFTPTMQSMNDADLKNATVAFAILGGVTGLVMGFAGGLAGRSVSRGVIVGLGAQALGGLVGALASLALVPLFYRQLVPDTNDLLSPIMIHAGVWMAIGAVGGLAFGIGLRCGRNLLGAVGGACLGACLATVVYHLLSASLFLDSGSTEPVATSPLVRLLAMLLVPVFVATGAARGALGRGPLKASPVSDL